MYVEWRLEPCSEHFRGADECWQVGRYERPNNGYWRRTMAYEHLTRSEATDVLESVWEADLRRAVSDLIDLD